MLYITQIVGEGIESKPGDSYLAMHFTCLGVCGFASEVRKFIAGRTTHEHALLQNF